MNRKIRLGMIGGGPGAFIGSVHRMAAALDGQYELVAGAFSSDPAKSKHIGEELFLDPARVYDTYHEMLTAEQNLSADVRIDVVAIVTPNHLHFGPSVMALEAGFHVICDKPVCHQLIDAYTLRDVVKRTDLIFALTHNYTGYPMVKQAKYFVNNHKLGKIRKVIVEYPQGWLSTFIEGDDHKQAAWRTDPTKSGSAGAMGDIGTHAENLAEYITSLKITELCADLSIMVDGRRLDDDGNVLLRFDNGARGILHASQIAAGEENNLKIRVYGELGGLEWSQMEPNSLIVRWSDKPTQIYRTGGADVCDAAMANTRVPAGHPEGYLEAFANIYKNVATAIRAYGSANFEVSDYDFPTIDDGVRGMEFIEKVIQSSNGDVKWVKM